MALFTLLTGLVVLVASIMTGRYQRIQESILLRTLGASDRTLISALLTEFAALGFIAATLGSASAEPAIPLSNRLSANTRKRHNTLFDVR